ncbi:YciI family protein [Corynebacterium kutscheri]|uniref:YCII-related domain protein n=1 Tax=Corynebacterium kutscheri TaxID=35755 RepID=A0AB38VUT2_9CORY|nr:YciI family protein [Corynebacterium kutscheri]VEH08699.1 YCII-related domain protein [Corynebacterium kutscheri]
MSYFAFIYHYDPTNDEIAATRPQHREFIASLNKKGQILGSGPFTEGNGGALIVLSLGDTATLDDATAIMNADPFYEQGLVDKREVHAWNPVIGTI